MATFEFGKNFGKETGLTIDAQHFAAQQVDDEEGPVPEFLLAVAVDEEWLEWIRDFIPHIAVVRRKTKAQRECSDRRKIKREDNM